MSIEVPQHELRLLQAFRRAAAEMPWYRTLLDEQHVRPEQIADAESFSRLCPVLTKKNTFDRFPLDQLAATTTISDLATVLTSSGHGGRFSFGLSNRSQAASGGYFIDQALDAAFAVKSKSTLAVNCLPMGVGFASECMTVATTSVREDMAVALVEKFGSYYHQVLLVGDPLFMKRLTDYAVSRGTDWSRYRVQVVLGEEVFGENFRSYLAACFGLQQDSRNKCYIMSSFGVGELGLHLCFETPATIAVRRSAWRNADFARDLLGITPATALPAILAFHPLRTFVEIEHPNAVGYGNLTISMLDTELPIPLLRYQTGDIARLLDAQTVQKTLQRYGIALSQELPAMMIALQGRAREALPNGSHVAVYKDALYAHPDVARHFTGAFKVVANGNRCSMHVQLARSGVAADGFEEAVLAAIPENVRLDRIQFWPYLAFPYGMTLDYERKFAYYDSE